MSTAMTGSSTKSVRPIDSACELTDEEPEQSQSINLLKRRHQDPELGQREPQTLSKVSGLEKRHRQNAVGVTMAGQDVIDTMAHSTYSDSTYPKILDERGRYNTRSSARLQQQRRKTKARWSSMPMHINPGLKGRSAHIGIGDYRYQAPPRMSPGSTRDYHEHTSDSTDDDYDPTSNEICGRGRTPERDVSHAMSNGTPYDSRASSASSARSMIDECMERAHQNRMRSASRENSIPQSPFHESSPFYAEFTRNLNLASQPRIIYECKCCPKKPKTFDAKDELRYVSAFILDYNR
jgi:hypothetical protein